MIYDSLFKFIQEVMLVVSSFDNKFSSKKILDYTKMIMSIIAVESEFEDRNEDGDGLYGIGKLSVNDVTNVFTNLENNLGVYHTMTKLWLKLETIPYWIPSANEIKRSLVEDDKFSIIMIYLHLKELDRIKGLIPSNAEEQALYWLRNYTKSNKPITDYLQFSQWSLEAIFEIFEALNERQLSFVINQAAMYE